MNSVSIHTAILFENALESFPHIAIIADAFLALASILGAGDGGLGASGLNSSWAVHQFCVGFCTT